MKLPKIITRETIKKATLLALAMSTVLFIASCGRIQDTEPEEVTLNIWYVFSINQVSGLANIFQANNPGVNLNVRFFGNNRQQYAEQLSAALMAGDAPDLFLMDTFNHKDPNMARMLVDWLPIMNAHPGFNTDDYFMNVFHSASLDGRLYAFPTHFFFGMVASNTTVPGLSEALNDRGPVNARDLMDLAYTFGNDLYINQGFDPVVATSLSFLSGGYIQNFIDVEARTANFNNQRFIDFITSARELTNPDTISTVGADINIISSEMEWAFSQRYLFMNYPMTTPQYVLPIENMHFEGHAPLVNDKGELVIHPWVSYGLSTGTTAAQQALAWEFIQFMQDPEARVTVGAPQLVSTYRPMMRHEFWRSIPDNNIFGANGLQFAVDREQAISDAIDLIEGILEMPMVDIHIMPDSINNIIMEIMIQFQDRLITAEQAAQYLQNRITLALMEISW